MSVIKLSMTCQDFAELFEEQDDPSSFWREFLMKRGYDTTGIDDAKEYTLNQVLFFSKKKIMETLNFFVSAFRK